MTMAARRKPVRTKMSQDPREIIDQLDELRLRHMNHSLVEDLEIMAEARRKDTFGCWAQ